MKNEFAKKESYYMAELAKKTKLIGLYKDENAGKDLRIKNLEKRIKKLKSNLNSKKSEPQKEEVFIETEQLPINDNNSIPVEISFENPVKQAPPPKMKDSEILPIAQFNNSVDFQNMPVSQNYDKNLEKSSARLEVITKQEEILLNLNKHLNSDSNLFPDQLISDLKLPQNTQQIETPKSNSRPVEVSSHNLGISLKKFSQKLMNVIDINNKVLKVSLIRVKQCGFLQKKEDKKKKYLLKISKNLNYP
jgi:hypothetical protein